MRAEVAVMRRSSLLSASPMMPISMLGMALADVAHDAAEFARQSGVEDAGGAEIG